MPAAVPVVKVTLATPLVLVDDAGEVNDPPLPAFDQVTVLPAVATGTPFDVASCAVTVTKPPAATEELLAVTRYLVAAGGGGGGGEAAAAEVEAAVAVAVGAEEEEVVAGSSRRRGTSFRRCSSASRGSYPQPG